MALPYDDPDQLPSLATEAPPEPGSTVIPPINPPPENQTPSGENTQLLIDAANYQEYLNNLPPGEQPYSQEIFDNLYNMAEPYNGPDPTPSFRDDYTGPDPTQSPISLRNTDVIEDPNVPPVVGEIPDIVIPPPNPSQVFPNEELPLSSGGNIADIAARQAEFLAARRAEQEATMAQFNADYNARRAETEAANEAYVPFKDRYNLGANTTSSPNDTRLGGQGGGGDGSLTYDPYAAANTLRAQGYSEDTIDPILGQYSTYANSAIPDGYTYQEASEMGPAGYYTFDETGWETVYARNQPTIWSFDQWLHETYGDEAYGPAPGATTTLPDDTTTALTANQVQFLNDAVSSGQLTQAELDAMSYQEKLAYYTANR